MTNEWQPIETAPRDGSEILIWSHAFSGTVVIVRWDDDRHANKPIPRWVTRDPVFGRRAFVDRQPTRWMPLPAAPVQS